MKGNLKLPLVLLSYMGRGAQERQQVYVSLCKSSTCSYHSKGTSLN